MTRPALGPDRATASAPERAAGAAVGTDRPGVIGRNGDRAAPVRIHPVDTRIGHLGFAD